MERPRLTLRDVAASPEVDALITGANRALGVLGYTEHGQRHASTVGASAQNLLLRLGYPERTAELAAIAGYLHDIGNVVNRLDHGHSSGLITYDVLRRLGMPIDEVVEVMTAVGHHEDDSRPVSEVSAAVIIADKADVHRSRVRNLDPRTFDIHDRVNYAVTSNALDVDPAQRIIRLDLTVDTTLVSIMDFFEIFLDRMVLSRVAAEFLQCTLCLAINGVVLESRHQDRIDEYLIPQFE
ncbi:MAG: phosphohydrolase [Dehalococcoidia bacterium]|nr:MAG: phosphohydrolase [Dehalococcoidia bacterium]